MKLFIVISTVISLLIFEYKFPFFKYATSFGVRVSSNLGLGLLNAIISGLFTLLVSNYSILTYPHQGILTKIESPTIAAILSILILDLYIYLWHRSMHIIPLAWRFHRVHHTDRSMNVSTAYRFHPIEIISSSIPKLILIWWLGISIEIAIFYDILFTIIVATQHSNINVPEKVDRILSHLIITPNCHRIHHSQIVTETNSNYGSVLSCWDSIFQTKKYHPNIIATQLGVKDESRALNIYQLLKLPVNSQ